MAFVQTIDHVLSTKIGPGGLSPRAVSKALADLEPALARLRDDHATGRLPLLSLPAERDDLQPTKDAVKALLKGGATDLVLLGTGGSSLGGQTLAQLGDYGVPGVSYLSDGLRLHFMDNLDPFTFAALTEKLPLKTSRFVSISKSGGTGETLMQTSVFIEALEKAGRKSEIGQHFLGLSEAEKPGKKNALRALLAPYGVPFLEHDPNVGGRYSVLTNVGLVPAAALGLKLDKLRKGAGVALAPVLAGKKARRVPAALGAALNLAASRSKKNITVLMGYGDRLERLTGWWQQLWAESLGKDGQGTHPVAALGPVDQHSQQQLYLAGPRDKLFTVITLGMKGEGPVIEAELAKRCNEPEFAGKTIGDLVTAQGRAMIDTFARNGRPVRHIHIATLDEASLGELLMHFMLETILTGYAMGVDPFDQPAVEEAKILAKRYLAEG